MSSHINQFAAPQRQHLWLRRAVALLAVLNLALVFFDLTYLNLRPFYLEVAPRWVELYDPVKGIRPHPEVQRYSERVAALESQVSEMELDSPEVEASLAELRSESQQLLLSYPPQNNTAALETIKDDLQARTGAATPFDAFDRFWSAEHLAQAGWPFELEFWNQQIRPLLAASYYRRVNRFGQPIDYFWLIDLPFVLIFALDLILRNRAIRRRYPELSGIKSLIRHSYDLLLLIPFWRWLRILPVTIRLYEVGLINLELLQAEVRRDVAIGFAKDVIELVGIQVIDQLQSAIRRGDVMQWLLYPELRRLYVQVNHQNELKVIATRMTNIVMYDVLPQVQPELEALFHYNLHHNVFDQVPGYRQLNLLPGIGRLPKHTAERLTQDVSKRVYRSLVQIWEDPVATEMVAQLFEKFRDALSSELQKQENVQEIENLLIDMLEEIKINYVKGLSEKDIEQIVDEAEQLYYQAKGSRAADRTMPLL